MAFSEEKTLIQVSPELRKRLKMMVVERGYRSYEDLLKALLDELDEYEKSGKEGK